MNHPPRHPLITGLATSIVLLLAVLLVIGSETPMGLAFVPPWEHDQTLHIALRNSDGLEPDATVEVAGVAVGHVDGIQLENGRAVATVDITDAAVAIHSDATVMLRPHGLFGPEYLDVLPGTAAQLLGNNATIGIANTVEPVSFGDVLDALQQPERQNLQTALVALGEASEGRGSDVHQLLVASNALTSDLQPIAAQLNGDAPALNSVINNAQSFNADFAKVPLGQLVANSNATLTVLATNASQLQDLLTQADSALDQLNTDLRGEQTNLHTAVAELPSVLTSLDTFNTNLSLFARNLTGTDTSMPGDTNVTSGLIAAIENPRSAFSSYDCTVKASTCPLKDRDYYLRVQIYNLAGTGGVSTATLPLCNLPVLGATTKGRLGCTSTSSASSTGGSSMLVGFASGLAS